jgi:hypothetical protein
VSEARVPVPSQVLQKSSLLVLRAGLELQFQDAAALALLQRPRNNKCPKGHKGKTCQLKKDQS